MGIVVRGELVQGLGAYLVSRDEPGYALGSTVGAYQLLPGLRGVWPMSSINSGGDVYDLSGQLRTLTQTGAPTLGYATTLGLGPCLTMDGSTQWLHRNDEGGLAITGAMTCGLWFRLNDLVSPEVDRHLLSKWVATSNQRSWSLYVDEADGYIEADITTDGSTVKAVLNDDETFANCWYFVAMRFTPSTELALFVYDEKWVNITGIPATIYDSTAPLEIGSIGHGGTIDLNGKVSLAFLCAYALSDAEINQLYYLSRPLFGLSNS